MTQIGRMFEQEKQEAVEAAAAEAAEKEQTSLAKQLVSIIDNLVKTTNQTLEAVCRDAGIDKSKYDEARQRLAMA